MPEHDPDRRERLDRALRDNHARLWHRRLPELLSVEIPQDAYRGSLQVAGIERLIAEQRHEFSTAVSRRRWTADLRHEAMASLRRFAAVPDPVVLIAIDPSPFFAVALPDADFLRQPDALVEAVRFFAVATEGGDGLLIFEWCWTVPYEGDWGELATWGRFRSLMP